MIKAVIENKDGGTLVTEFPCDTYKLYNDLNSIGIMTQPYKVKLTDTLTDYGAISARGRSLFELVPYREPESKELITQTITDEKLDVIELLDRKALFSNGRFSPEEIPEGLYAYDLRFSDEQDRFVSIEPKVGTNHGGTVLMKELLDFGENGAISFTEDSSPNFLSEEMTVKEFAEMDMDEDKEMQMGGM